MPYTTMTKSQLSLCFFFVYQTARQTELIQENSSLQETVSQFRDQIIAAADAENEEETASERLDFCQNEIKRLEREVQHQTTARQKIQEELDISKEDQGKKTIVLFFFI